MAKRAKGFKSAKKRSKAKTNFLDNPAVPLQAPQDDLGTIQNSDPQVSNLDDEELLLDTTTLFEGDLGTGLNEAITAEPLENETPSGSVLSNQDALDQNSSSNTEDDETLDDDDTSLHFFPWPQPQKNVPAPPELPADESASEILSISDDSFLETALEDSGESIECADSEKTSESFDIANDSFSPASVEDFLEPLETNIAGSASEVLDLSDENLFNFHEETGADLPPIEDDFTDGDELDIPEEGGVVIADIMGLGINRIAADPSHQSRLADQSKIPRPSKRAPKEINLLEDISGGQESLNHESDQEIEIAVPEVEVSGIYQKNAELSKLESELLESTRIPPVEDQLNKPRPSVSTILLSVAKAGSFSRVIQYHFKKAGWRVQLAEGADETLNIVSPEFISLVIADNEIKGFSELCLELKINKSTNNIPIIGISPETHSYHAAREIRALPDEELNEPFEMARLLEHADWELARAFKSGVIFDQRLRLVLPTRTEKIDQVKIYLQRLLRQTEMSKEIQTETAAAVGEAIGNAARHGNKNRPAKNIELLYLLDRRKVAISIKDEGEGFDHSPYCAEDGVVDKVHILKERLEGQNIGTLGIPLLARCVDKVQYNETGSLVTLTKNLKPRD